MKVGSTDSTLIDFQVKQRSVYTTYIFITVNGEWGRRIPLPSLDVRLYHDLKMAEVVFSHHSRQLEPLYDYPNERMYQSNEKESWNEFLMDLIHFCYKGEGDNGSRLPIDH